MAGVQRVSAERITWSAHLIFDFLFFVLPIRFYTTYVAMTSAWRIPSQQSNNHLFQKNTDYYVIFLYF